METKASILQEIRSLDVEIKRLDGLRARRAMLSKTLSLMTSLSREEVPRLTGKNLAQNLTLLRVQNFLWSQQFASTGEILQNLRNEWLDESCERTLRSQIKRLGDRKEIVKDSKGRWTLPPKRKAG